MKSIYYYKEPGNFILSRLSDYIKQIIKYNSPPFNFQLTDTFQEKTVN